MRLPTKEDFEKLCECYTRFDEGLRGRWFFDRKTGEELFLPCEGYRGSGGARIHLLGEDAYYWSSTTCWDDRFAIAFFFWRRSLLPNDDFRRLNGCSVRLVSDEPFEGAVHVAGLYWKSTNEEGYYTWDEAMEKFND